MFKFTKGFIKNNETKIATDYIKITDIDRINIIKERNKGINNKEIKENKNIYRDRINALNHIKKG